VLEAGRGSCPSRLTDAFGFRFAAPPMPYRQAQKPPAVLRPGRCLCSPEGTSQRVVGDNEN
jgi:hypothetical protein